MAKKDSIDSVRTDLEEKARMALVGPVALVGKIGEEVVHAENLKRERVDLEERFSRELAGLDRRIDEQDERIRGAYKAARSVWSADQLSDFGIALPPRKRPGSRKTAPTSGDHPDDGATADGSVDAPSATSDYGSSNDSSGDAEPLRDEQGLDYAQAG